MPLHLLFCATIRRSYRKKHPQCLLLKVFFPIRTPLIVASAVKLGLARTCNVHTGVLCGSGEARASGGALSKVGVGCYRVCHGAHDGEKNFETEANARGRKLGCGGGEGTRLGAHTCLHEPPSETGQVQLVDVILRPSADNTTSISYVPLIEDAGICACTCTMIGEINCMLMRLIWAHGLCELPTRACTDSIARGTRPVNAGAGTAGCSSSEEIKIGPFIALNLDVELPVLKSLVTPKIKTHSILEVVLFQTTTRLFKMGSGELW